MFLFLTSVLTYAQNPAEESSNKRKEIDDQIAKLRQYKEASLTTIGDFMEDGWKCSDFFRGKIGISKAVYSKVYVANSVFDNKKRESSEFVFSLDFTGEEASEFMLKIADDMDEKIINAIAGKGSDEFTFNIANKDKYSCVLYFKDGVLTGKIGCDFEWVKEVY